MRFQYMPRNGFVALAFALALLILSLPHSLAARTPRVQTDFPANFQRGAEAMRAGHLEQAADDFLRCLAAQPNSPEVHFNLGLVRFQQGRWIDASKELSGALKSNPDLRGADLFLGISNYRLDRYGDAVEHLELAAMAEPSNLQAWMWLGMAQLAAGDAKSSVQSLQRAKQLKPADVDVLFHLGRAYMQLSKDTYQHMYQADPKSWRVHQVLCDSFEQADRLDDAAKECQVAVDLKPNEPGLHQQLGDIHWKQSHLEQAEAEFERELAIEPQNLTAMFDLAAVQIDRSKPETAVKLLTDVVQQHPDATEAHYQLGRANAQLGDVEGAIQEFSAVVKHPQASRPETLRQSYWQLSQLYRRTQHADEARVALSAFLKLKQQADTEQDQKLQDKLKRSTEPKAQ